MQAALRGLKQRTFGWNYECLLAFTKLQEALCLAPVLAFLQEKGQYYLDTGASVTSIGAVLSQMQNDQERVLTYE